MHPSIKITFIGGLVALIFLIGFFAGNIPLFSSSLSPLNTQPIEGRVITNKIVAVDDAGKGVVAELTTIIRDGSGLVLVNINDVLADLNAQYSARTATKVASDYTKRNLDTVDVIFTINTHSPVGIVGGQSAGSTMALSLIAGLLNKTIRSDVIMTGSILENGTIGEAGALQEKAKAARDNNATLFLIPAGSGKVIKGYAKNKECETRSGYEYCTLQYIARNVDIGDVAGLDVKEVADIAEAVTYYLT